MITVLGLDGSELSETARERLAGAALVVGGQRHLDQAADALAVTSTRMLLRSDLGVALTRISDETGDVVVLASGDPGLFGIVRLLRERFPDTLEVLPAVSSVALAFARAGLPWDDAVVVSAHGRSLGPAVAACTAHPKVAVLTTDGADAAALITALRGTGRRVFVAERLGLDGERTGWVADRRGSGAAGNDPGTEVGSGDGVAPTHPGRQGGGSAAAVHGPFDDLNVVLSIDPARAVAPKGWLAGRAAPLGWALPEDRFSHRDGMLTKAEVRAVALAHLSPRLGDTVWDIGAGSGSVAVECARLGAAVVAVEQGDLTHLHANVASFEVDVQVVHGRAPEALDGLPDPDAVFVGGGGADVADIVRACVTRGPRTVVVALATLERLGPVRGALAAGAYEVDGVLLQASRLRQLGDATGLQATNPVLLVWGERQPAVAASPGAVASSGAGAATGAVACSDAVAALGVDASAGAVT